MFTQWLQQHLAAPLILAWIWGAGCSLYCLLTAGLVGGGRRLQCRVVLLVYLALLGAGLCHVLAVPMPSGFAWLLDYDGVRLEVQWAAVAVLLFFTASGPRDRHGVGSLLPLLINGWQGGGALLATTIIAATGALERGRPGRGPLLGAMLLFPLAGFVDRESLLCWIQLTHWGLGFDPASLVVDLSEQLLRLAAWLAGVAAVSARA